MKSIWLIILILINFTNGDGDPDDVQYKIKLANQLNRMYGDLISGKYSGDSDVRKLLSTKTGNYNNDRCNSQLQVIMDQFNKTITGPTELWANQMYDASGKIPDGLLYGNQIALGNFDECMDIFHNDTDGSTINGQYCLTPINLALEDFGGSSFNNFVIMTGLCIPDTCEPTYFFTVLYIMLAGTQATVIPMDPEHLCIIDNPMEWAPIDIVAVVIFSIIIALMIASTMYDVYTTQMKQPKRDLFMAYSIVTNGKRLLSVARPKSPDVMNCLNGIRVLSLVWVIFGHSFSAVMLNPINSSYIYNQWITNRFAMILAVSDVSVDSFFLLSGLLVIYNVFKELKKSNGKLNVPMMYLHRYLRIVPPLAMTLLLTVSFIAHTGIGPFSQQAAIRFSIRPCETWWWTSLLFIQNYVNPNELYSLVQTVVEACQKKTHCKFIAQPKSFRGDPCPGIRRTVDIAYKCRPYEFRSKVACENDVVQLQCNPYSRIAIYSASYGRTEYESLQCTQPQGVREETCLVSYATETVMQICHGRRKCSLSADSSTFGNPCRPDSRMYLKVVYTCVPRKVLNDQYNTPPEPDEPNQIDADKIEKQQRDNQVDEIYDEDPFYRESEAIPPAPKLQGDLTKTRADGSVDTTDVVGSQSPPFKTLDDDNGSSLQENQERLYLYLIISVTAAILLCLTLVIGRLMMQRRSMPHDPKIHQSNTGETTLPNGFTDDISEIDADIDLTTPIQISSVSRNEPTYSSYNPSSIGPYSTSTSNFGLNSNISSSTLTTASHPAPMLIPASSIISNMPTHTAIRGGSILVPSHSIGQLGGMQPHMTGTLPLHRTPSTGSGIMGPQSYLSGSIVGHGTLRRPFQQSQLAPAHSYDLDTTLPRSLIRGGDNSQYYYG